MSELRDAVIDAAARAEVREASGQIYIELEAEIAARRPLCIVSGRCCRFEEYGHRLYVTTMELAHFWHEFKKADWQRPVAAGTWDGAGCPFQINKLCSVHAMRPFGCRIYFCDASSTQWQHDAYERLHGKLRSLHDQLLVPYYYVEWRYALRELGLGAVS